MDEAERPLKRAHFILPHIATVYPISSQNPPSTPTLKEEKRAIEDREKERRRRVVRGNQLSSVSSSSSTPTSTVNRRSLASSESSVLEDEDEELWNVEKVGGFYRECCEGCEEVPDPMIVASMKRMHPGNSRTLDLSGVQLSVLKAGILADVLTIEWGLKKLVCKECDLDEFNLKPLLHSLLITDSITFLSLSSNRKLVTSKDRAAFKLIAAFLTKSTSLQFLDLSQNPLDKRCVELLIGPLSHTAPNSVSTTATSSPEPTANSNLYGLTPTPHAISAKAPPRSPSLTSLRLDDANIRGAGLELLSRVVRTSTLKHISLRHNKIGPQGAVAVALMVRDYPDAVTGGVGLVNGVALSSPTPSSSSLNGSNFSGSGTNSPSSTLSPPGTPLIASPSLSFSSAALPPPVQSGPLPPPPRHPGQAPQATQTTYTPYIPRAKRAAAGQSSAPASAPAPPPIRANTMLPAPTHGHPPGSLQARLAAAASGRVAGGGARPAQPQHHPQQHHDQGPSAALLDKVRALDALPRIGSLKTLDLKGNDIRSGVTYIAQVLKRNRTLKVLNLSENKLDVQGLVAIAEALKYNSCLETLDLSKNPIGSPSLQGIQSLRSAFTLNTSLRRLFLSNTQLTSPAALALASFLPTSRSLIHLDLTQNPGIGLDGVKALCEGLRGNWVMRCLDLDVPMGEEVFAGVCREILRICVRNTEEAERSMREKDGLLAGEAGEHAAGSRVKDMLGDGGMKTPSGTWVGQPKGVWMMLEESELAKGVRMGELEADVVKRSRVIITLLNEILFPTSPTTTGAPESSVHPALLPVSANASLVPIAASLAGVSSVFDRLRAPPALVGSPLLSAFSSSSASSSTSSLALSPHHTEMNLPALVEQAREVMEELSRDIELSMMRDSPKPSSMSSSPLISTAAPNAKSEAGKLEEKLGVYDDLVQVFRKAEERVKEDEEAAAAAARDDGSSTGGEDDRGSPAASGSPAIGGDLVVAPDGSQQSGTRFRPQLTLKGLGVHLNTGQASNIDRNRWNSLGTSPGRTPSPSFAPSESATLHAGPDSSNDTPTPRIDKGKRKAEPLPEPPERVLSPTKALMEEVLSMTSGGSSSDEDDFRDSYVDAEDGADGEDDGKAITEERSKSWVEEEGEVFRKGAVLLGPEEMEGEYAGDDLRKELLDTMVERQPRPRPIDEFGFANMDEEDQMNVTRRERQSSVSSNSSSILTSSQSGPLSPTGSVHSIGSVGPPGSPSKNKAPPRPYVSRSRSSSSLMSLVSGVSLGSGTSSAVASPSLPSQDLGSIGEDVNVLGTDGPGMGRRRTDA